MEHYQWLAMFVGPVCAVWEMWAIIDRLVSQQDASSTSYLIRIIYKTGVERMWYWITYHKEEELDCIVHG